MVSLDQRLSIARQCRLSNISRSTYYYESKGESFFNQKLMRMIDEQYLKTPSCGVGQMARWLRRQGYCVGRKRVRLFTGLAAIDQRTRRLPQGWAGPPWTRPVPL